MHTVRLLVLLVTLAAPLGGQQRLSADTEVRASPSGNAVATLKEGTSWATGTTRNGWTLLTIQGWVEASRFAGPRDTFPQSIGGSGTLRIREEPSLNGRILGEFRAGAGIRVLERRQNWAKIRRDVWVPAGALAAAGQGSARTTPTVRTPATGGQAAPSASPATPAQAASRTPPAAVQSNSSQISSAGDANQGQSSGGDRSVSGSIRSDAAVTLRTAPGGNTVGELAAGTVVAPVARDRGWVKVQVEAWVPESLFVPADTSYRAQLTAVDLRMDPVGSRGKVVRWEVQVVGLQYADPLRRDLAPEEPFLLAVGPKGEDVILYVAVPPGLLEEAKNIPPMTPVILTARVRTGRSQPTGAPVLELQSLLRK